MSDFKRTKIVATVGPASSNYETLKKMAQAGMDVVRLNFSHGSHEERLEQIKVIRRISKELNKPLTIFADLSGPKLRLGEIDGVRKITEGEKIHLSLNPVEDELPMQFDLAPFVKKGQRIYLNDGLVELKVTEVAGKSIKTIAQNNGVVSSHKGVNVPDTYLKGAAFTSKDEDDAIFALKQNVDYLALSFVQTADDIKKPKQLILQHNPAVKLIAKIEKKEALNNLEAILDQVSAVMVARGDLAIETSNAEVPLAQQRIIKLARQVHKPVIVATQMLESMIENPRPTRAEVSDVANAVMDQVDAVMLSAESASGKYPVEAIETMTRVIKEVESFPEYKHYVKINWEVLENQDIELMAISSSAASLGFRIDAKGIVVGTVSGKSAKILSSFRPHSKIIAVTHDEQTCNQLALVWGVKPIIVKPSLNFNLFIEHIEEKLAEAKALDKGEKYIIVTGTSAGISGTTNTIKVSQM